MKAVFINYYWNKLTNQKLPNIFIGLGGSLVSLISKWTKLLTNEHLTQNVHIFGWFFSPRSQEKKVNQNLTHPAFGFYYSLGEISFGYLFCKTENGIASMTHVSPKTIELSVCWSFFSLSLSSGKIIHRSIGRLDDVFF